MDIEIKNINSCNFVFCPFNYKYDPRISAIVYDQPTHYVQYSSNGKLLITLNIRYSPYYSGFHIIGFTSSIPGKSQ